MAGSIFLVARLAVGVMVVARNRNHLPARAVRRDRAGGGFVPVVFKALRETRYEADAPESHGVPSTSEAIYEAVPQPCWRVVRFSGDGRNRPAPGRKPSHTREQALRDGGRGQPVIQQRMEAHELRRDRSSPFQRVPWM